jgi:Cupin
VDELAEVIAGLCTGRAYTSWVRRSGSWGERYSGLRVSGFHLLMRGAGWLITPTDEPRALVPGDVVLAPLGGEHGLSHAPASLGNCRPRSSVRSLIVPQRAMPNSSAARTGSNANRCRTTCRRSLRLS